MMKNDRTDIITYGSVALVLVAMFLLFQEKPPGAAMGGRQPPAADRGTEAEVIALRSYLGHYPPAEEDKEKIELFVRENPENSRAVFLLAELYYKGGELREAAYGYRRALQINRGFADAKSELFEGAKLKRFAEEGLKVYLREKNLRPDDENVRTTIKDLYFIRRALAGGCD